MAAWRRFALSECFLYILSQKQDTKLYKIIFFAARCTSVSLAFMTPSDRIRWHYTNGLLTSYL